MWLQHYKIMTTTTCPSKTTTFYQLLEQTPGLDMRDNRGKVHSIALVISGLVMALCCGRDGKLSSLHRNMVNHFTALCKATNSSQAKPISRSQLPILLAKVNGAIFSKLLLDWFNGVVQFSGTLYLRVFGNKCSQTAQG